MMIRMTFINLQHDFHHPKQIMSNDLEDLALRLQGIIETAIDGIITISQHGNIETVNPAAATQFGYKPEEIIGHNIKILMPDPYHSEHDGYLHRYNTTKKPHIIGIGREVTGKTKDGALFPFKLAVSEVILNDRVIFTGIIHDLSSVKTAEQKLINLNVQLEEKIQVRTDELEQAVNRLLATNKEVKDREKQLAIALSREKELNELKSRFVSMASHEFRTPLSTIMSSASLISKYTTEAQNDKREKHVNRIKSAVVNLTGILNDFLSLSKIEEGKVELKKTEVKVEALCLLVMDEVKGLLKNGQKIKHHIDEDVKTIISDNGILKNILFNIISNAIKYSNPEGLIQCHISKIKEGICFKIKDEGIGIPEAEQKHLFERFFRASNVENIQGTGLGMSIVKRYVELLEGNISFESIENKGTTFTINIRDLAQ